MSRYCLALTLICAGFASADEPEKPNVEITGSLESRGLPMAECDLDVFRIKLVANVDKNGNGKGVLTLDCTPNPVDEFGDAVKVDTVPPVKLDCTLKLVKTRKMLVERGNFGAAATEVEVQLIEISGPRIVSKLTLTHEVGRDWSYARFLWSTKEGKNRTSVAMHGQTMQLQRPPPCHPGCFPAGTFVLTPNGNRSIENLRVGHEITTIGGDGKPVKSKVTGMFLTKNRLLEITIEGKKILTTATQPLSLADGKLKAAGELKVGDRIELWVKGERKPAAIKAIEPTLRLLPVYNVVVGDPTLFVADGIIARSKPPAKDVATP